MNNDMNSNLNIEQNDYGNMPMKESHNEEKKAKKQITILALSGIGVLLIGVISGFFILKGLNKGVKESSFMYDILSKSGLLFQKNELNELENATDANSTLPEEYKNNLIFIQEKNDIKYYYYKTPKGDYLYYYTYSSELSDDEQIYIYYASDSNGHYMKETYKDPVPTTYFTVPDFKSMTIEEIQEQYWEYVDIISVLNTAYKENEVYYQSIKTGEKVPFDEDGWLYNRITLLVNREEKNDNE